MTHAETRSSRATSEYPIPLTNRIRLPVLRGWMRGRWWLPSAGGKILRILFGTYEREQTALVANHLRQGDVLFDVGAAVGYYTLLAAPLVGREGRVLSFEPDPKNAAFLRQHVAANRFSNVEVHQTAIGDRTGQAKFAAGTGTGTGHLDQTGEVTVAMWRIDDLIGRARIPSHIKIDVEGAELLVLEGARNTLLRAKPTLFLSTHGTEIHHACCRFLSTLGYTFRLISSDPQCDSEILCTAGECSSASTQAWNRIAA